MNKAIADSTMTTPISREELALFYEAQRIATNEAITNALKAQSDSIINILNTQSIDFKNSLTSISDAVNSIATKYSDAVTDINKNMLEVFGKIDALETDRVNKITAISNNAIDAINKVSERIDYASSQSRKQYYAIHGAKPEIVPAINPVFVSSYTERQELDWLEVAKGKITEVCMNYGLNKGVIYKYIYDCINKTHNLDALLTEFKASFNLPGADTMRMISHSDLLRSYFSSFYGQYVSGVKNELKRISAVRQNNLKKINRSVGKLSPTGKCPGTVYKKAYSIVSKYIGTDVKEAARNLIEKNNLVNATIPAAIACDDKLTETFCYAINKYLVG